MDDEIREDNGNSLDFGARMLDSRLGRWFSRDPAFIKYPSFSTYNFVLNNPIMFIDPDGEEPFNPRTQSAFKGLNLYRYAIVSLEKPKHLKKKVDKVLLSSVDIDSPLYSYRKINDGYDGTIHWTAKSARKQTSEMAWNELSNLYPDQASRGAPNDIAWNEAAKQGTYVFKENFAESMYLYWAWSFYEYNYYKVEENRITEITTLNRSSDDEKFDISSVTTFSYNKEWTTTSWEYDLENGKQYEVTVKHAQVTETVYEYKDNKRTGKSESKTYNVVITTESTKKEVNNSKQ